MHQQPVGGPLAQWLPSGPDHADDTVHALLLAAAYHAQRRIVAVTPYFVPDDALLDAWCLACRRGVRVSLLVPARSNHRLADIARERALRQLAAAGAQVWLAPAMVHAKAVLIDDDLALAGSLNLGLAGVIFSFMLVNLFDSSGTLIGVTDKAGLADAQGKFPRMKQALFVDSVSSVAGSFIGTSSVTAYIESSSGVSVGGRTGLTAVVVGLLFLLVIFLSPLAGMVPAYAAAGALIYVGVLMTSSLARVKWDDLTESVPAFITAVMMPFSFSITEGIALGFISYCVMKIGTGRLRDLSPCVIVVSLLFVLKIVFIDAK